MKAYTHFDDNWHDMAKAQLAQLRARNGGHVASSTGNLRTGAAGAGAASPPSGVQVGSGSPNRRRSTDETTTSVHTMFRSGDGQEYVSSIRSLGDAGAIGPTDIELATELISMYQRGNPTR